MERPELTFLTTEQCFGSNKLNIFNEMDLIAEPTDFAYYFGGCLTKDSELHRNNGYYWTQDTIEINKKNSFKTNAIFDNEKKLTQQNIDRIGARLIVNFSDIEKYCKNIIKKQFKTIEFEFGEYIQDIAPLEIQYKINNDLFKTIEITNYKYFLFLKHIFPKTNIKIKETSIYINKETNQKYIKIPTSCIRQDAKYLKRIYGLTFSINECIWLEIKPIKWIKHENDDYAITEKILFSGIPYNKPKQNYIYFYDSYIKDYLDTYFSKEIIQSNFKFQENNNDKNEIEKIEPRIEPMISKKTLQYEPVYLKDNPFDYGVYLTDTEYSSNPAIGREIEIRELEKKLLKPKKGVILVGDAGVGKTAIVEGLAYKIQNRNVCDLLKNKGILSINIGELLAGTIYRGSFEQKIIDLCKNLAESKNVILFLDEMHTTIGAGGASEQSLDMANMLKTYISNDQIKVIGCTTKEEYETYFIKDKAFNRRFSLIEIPEIDELTLKNILTTTMEVYSNRFNTKINLTDLEIQKIFDIIIKLSHRIKKYLYEKQKNPDASIDILSECFTYFVVENIYNVKYEDFINAIIDNQSLNLSKQEIENLLLTQLTNEDIYESNRRKILTLNKKGNF